MPLQRKRHNPEITPADLAAQAFDRNNDAVLEDKIQAEKGNLALRQEFCQLITEVFGRDIYLDSYGNNLYATENDTLKDTLLPLSVAGHYRLTTQEWSVSTLKQKAGWFRSAQYEKYFKIVPAVIPKKGMLPIFEDGKFNPIKMITYTPEALSKAKDFAKAYKSMTEQDVTLVQEFADKEEIKKHVPKENLEGAVDDCRLFEDINKIQLDKKIATERRRFKRNLFRGLVYGAGTTNSLVAAAEEYQKGNINGALFWGGLTLAWGLITLTWYKDETSKYEKFLNETYKK